MPPVCPFLYIGPLSSLCQLLLYNTRKYLPKLELKECEVMIALYIDRLSVTATAAKLRVDASTVRRRRDSACDKIRKAMEEK